MTVNLELPPNEDSYLLMRRRTAGFPSKYTPETIDKLERAWMMGCSDTEAVILAGISRATLLHYFRATEGKDNDLKERRDTLRNWHVLMARRNLGMVLARPADHGLTPSAIELSKWYLSKRKADEFGDQKEPPNPGGTLASSFEAILQHRVEVKSSTVYIKKPDGPTESEPNDLLGGSVQEGTD